MDFFRRILPKRARVDIDEIDDAPRHADPRLPVHILSHDAVLHLEDGMPVVESDGSSRPLRISEVSLIALHGGARVTAPCLSLLAEHGVPLLLLSRSGYYRAQLVDLNGPTTATRRAHYAAAASDPTALAIAQTLVEAKILSARHHLRRRLGASSSGVKTLRRQASRARKAKSRATLMGIEGAAAAVYWAAWPEILRNDSDAFTFDGRSRRPARDAINALLSYLYAVCAGSAAAGALAAGLDPRVGFLHVERPGRPALALDLVEPMRTAIVDAAVIAAVNRRVLDGGHFHSDPEQGVRLTDDGRRLALELLEDRLSREVEFGGRRMSWRAAFSRYTLELAHHLREGGRPPTPPRLD